MFRHLVTLILVLTFVMAAPEEDDPFVTFRNGKIGVNFLGYKASAGLGALLTGNPADGFLSASAETPFGQRAAAGLGGLLGGDGASGGLYAGATSGFGPQASAGLGGSVGHREEIIEEEKPKLS